MFADKEMLNNAVGSLSQLAVPESMDKGGSFFMTLFLYVSVSIREAEGAAAAEIIS